ncbi:hypothetical protein NDA10_006414 [Ustilago hordei]|nr:hypothetical protein NDA10_006414 [Ustilago hordei]KAJ1570281.1 hypothetical protein NDA12_007647 [Ustilago hordei]KAJ1571977.1 hypothetical protein NDA15_001595 [Ustilago hordei]UTT92866.1 hypothetical protein NDA17_005114 [Ustilago hordei]
MTASPEPYLLASTLLTPEELPRLALITYDPSTLSSSSTSGSTSKCTAHPPPPHTQRIFVIVSNVSFGVEQSCILVIKPRRKDPNSASLLTAIPILADLKVEIEPQQGLTASAATPRNHPPAATTLGLSSLPQTLPTIHALLESVVPDLFGGGEKGETSNAALKLKLSHGGQGAEGVTSDARGLKDFLSVLKDLLKVAQENAFEVGSTHSWMNAYTDDLSHHAQSQHEKRKGEGEKGGLQLDPPIFSRLSSSSFFPHHSYHPPAAGGIERPASPTANDLRISIGTFNTNGQLLNDDIPSIIGLKKWLRAEQDPDLIVVGFQEVDASSGAYLYYSPTREDAWVRSITHALGRRADGYRKMASKQLVGLLIIVFARREMEGELEEIATASVGVGLGGFVANKGAVAVRMVVGERSLCFVNSHLSAYEGLQAMERRCWDWNEIYRRLRFRRLVSKIDFWESPGIKRKGEGIEGDESPFKTSKDAEVEASVNGDHKREPEVVEEAMSTTLQGTPQTDGTDAPTSPLTITTPSTSTTGDAEATTHIEYSIMAHDIIINFGDLNFRLDLSHSEAHRLIRERDFATLYRYDQLESLRTSGSLFDDFEEGKIDFAPTYKFDKGTDRYDTSEKQRVPAWTDRILWAVTKEWDLPELEGKERKDEEGGSATQDGAGDGQEKRKKQGVILQSYESISDLKFSDHRPVRATFLVRIR